MSHLELLLSHLYLISQLIDVTLKCADFINKVTLSLLYIFHAMLISEQVFLKILSTKYLLLVALSDHLNGILKALIFQASISVCSEDVSFLNL